MKTYLTLLILLIAFFECTSQTCSTICDADLLRGPFPFNDYSTVTINYAKPGGLTNPKYRDVQYAAESCIANDNCTQSSNDLKYRVFYPSGYTKQQFKDCPLPCVIVAHPGEFSDCSDFNLTSGYCRDFVNLGFVAIN